MSRGWESKSVESQQAEMAEAQAAPNTSASGAAQSGPVVQTREQRAEIKGNLAADADRKRQRQALELQRERILSERTSSPHRRSALSVALADIEERLGELGWTVHL